MPTFHVDVRVTLRPVILDPQGKAVAGGLHSLGFTGIGQVRVGKLIALEIDAADEAEATSTAEAACRQLLANPVMEDFAVTVTPSADAATAALAAQSADGTPR